MLKSKLLQQGAEAKIILKDNVIIKDRISKSYRLKELDEKIRKHRTKIEKKLLEKASTLIHSPKPLNSEENYQIKMPYIKGKKLSENLNLFPLKKQKIIMEEIGKKIVIIHRADIIHGDLTTSNMILNTKNEIILIDFGLGFISNKIEDKAVDLHLLRQALESKHFQNWEKLFEFVIKGYKHYEKSENVLERLKIIEKRGRYKF